MDFSDIRTPRRVRCKSLQNREKMGILPAEELALERALRASLMGMLKRKSRVAEARMDLNNEMEELKVKTEGEDGEEKNENAVEDDEEDALNLSCLAEGVSVSVPDSFKQLSSPIFSEGDSSSSSNFGRASCPRSATSTPPLNHSSSTLHLFVSSSSSPCSSVCSVSSDCPSSPWSPRTERENGKKKAIKWKKKGTNGSTEDGRKGSLKGSAMHDSVGKKRRLMSMGEEERTGVEVLGLKEKDKEAERRWKRSLAKEIDKESFYQPQRKFASNHTPPVRRYLARHVEVKDCKQLPKTEDFITYLCLRGSGDIPHHLQKFALPWTPAAKKPKLTKTKKKVSKTKASAAPNKLNYIASPDR